jgi:type 1 glutamine amidotransferase
MHATQLPKLCTTFAAVAAIFSLALTAGAQMTHIVYDGYDGPGKGKHIVFVTGDEEYRSEESMPMMAKILAKHHGFKCTVLFAIDKDTGEINPNQVDNIPGLEALDTADLMVIFTRFRDLPDDQMKHIVDYINSGKPIIGIRTATHAFRFQKNKTYEKYTWNRKGDFEGGFGRQVLGETWVAHYGKHQVESTRGVVAEGMADHPILRGVGEIWGPSDVYAINSLTGDAKPILMGQVLEGMSPEDKPVADKEMVPVAWIKTYTGDEGKVTQIFATTMGHGDDFKDPDFRRMIVNAAYWLLGMDVPEKANVEIIGDYDPNPIGFNKAKQGVKVEDHLMMDE